MYHFYSLAVEAGFYGDTGRVIGFVTKLSNIISFSTWMGDRGARLCRRPGFTLHWWQWWD